MVSDFLNYPVINVGLWMLEKMIIYEYLQIMSLPILSKILWMPEYNNCDFKIPQKSL